MRRVCPLPWPPRQPKRAAEGRDAPPNDTFHRSFSPTLNPIAADSAIDLLPDGTSVDLDRDLSDSFADTCFGGLRGGGRVRRYIKVQIQRQVEFRHLRNNACRDPISAHSIVAEPRDS
jgi:hypothetical protein